MEKESQRVIRLGIIGTGRIAKRFVSELELVSSIQAIAAYNPKLKSASEFADAFDGIKSFDDMDSFFNLVDAVYIASPHETHFDYTKRALKAKKHVLCEKPMCFSFDEAKELYGYADANNVVLIEALKTLYMPGFKKLCEVISSGTIGKIHMVEATFTKLVEENSREYRGEYAGSIPELGSYGILGILKVLGSDYKGVRAEKIKNSSGVDIFSRIHFEYNDALATVNVGIGSKSEGSMVISGEKGYIYVPAPWWFVKEFEIRRENPRDRETFQCDYKGEGLSYEALFFAEKISHPDLEDNRDLSMCISSVYERIV